MPFSIDYILHETLYFCVAFSYTHIIGMVLLQILSPPRYFYGIWCQCVCSVGVGFYTFHIYTFYYDRKSNASLTKYTFTYINMWSYMQDGYISGRYMKIMASMYYFLYIYGIYVMSDEYKEPQASGKQFAITFNEISVAYS